MDSKILISIVIPTRNRKNILKKCLVALNNQNYDFNKFEIVIIDDGSNQNNKKMIENLNLKPEVKYTYQEHAGPSTARNNGIKKARGKYIIFIDDDIIVNKEFIKSHIEKLKNNDRVIVHGPVIYTNDLNNPTSAEKKMRDFSNAFFATGNASIKKEYLLKAGLFNERFKEYGWEDLEFGQRLKELDLKTVKAENAIGYHLKYKFSIEDIQKIRNREKQRGKMAVLYHEINPSFAVKFSTLYWKPLILILEILTLGNWPQKNMIKKIVEYLHKKDNKHLRNFILYFIKLDAYLTGLKEGYN